MSTQAIRSIFEKRILQWSQTRTPQIAVAVQNVVFTPPANAMYLQVFILPAATSSNDFGGKHRDYRGICQVSIVCPTGIGAGHSEKLASDLDLLFPVNLPLTALGLTVFVRTPVSVGVAVPGTNDYTVPVSFGYESQIYLP